MEFSSQYNPKEVEEKIYQIWEESGFFNPDNLPGERKESFTITIPPPNVTGSLHMGHALNTTIQDILIRKKRMEGYRTLLLPGTDHAGIALQNVIEKDLKKQGLTRHDLGKEKFIEKIWEWKDKYGNIILSQYKKLGSSMDWSRTRFTMDENYQKAVSEAFLHYHKKGWLYKAERVINWCTKDQTSLSDLELEYQEEKGKLWFIKYPLADNSGYLTVATTRPETMLGDSAVAVNPKDERYSKFIGKKLILPIQNREIPIIADGEIEISFGTGAVKITPAHDLLDARIGEKHNLPVYKVIGPVGKMTEEAGSNFAGTKITDCREKVIEELKKQNLIEKEQDYTHNVAICYRCATVIEPQPSLQWFVKMEELSKLAITAVKNGEVIFHPKHWEKVYLDWLENIRDWNISRQIWWGHKIPIEGENDVLDTWFSAALWPFATLGWPQKTHDLETFYPTQVMVTARDIINLWVARMVYSGLEFTNKKPFTDIIIHGTILTKEGKRMSKSLGTGFDPINLIEKYGADATRFGIIWQSIGNQDIHWDETAVMAGKKFANKLWNATRFVVEKTENSFSDSEDGELEKILKLENLTLEDRKILENLREIVKSVDEYLKVYQLGQALRCLYDFFWHQFCDLYLETAKVQMTDPELQESTKKILTEVLKTSLKLFHPFIPFVTEEIWSKLPIKNRKLLMIEEWPKIS